MNKGIINIIILSIFCLTAFSQTKESFDPLLDSSCKVIDNIDKDAVIMKSAGQYTYLYNTVFVYDNIVYSSEVLFKGSKEQKPERIITKYLESYIK